MSGKDLLGGVYSGSCEVLRGKVTKVATPMKGDLVFFKGTRHSGANHIAIIYKVDGGKIYTIEGNTSGGSTVVDNGGGVARKSYTKTYNRILSYGRPKYTKDVDADDVLKIANNEVGYLEKKTNAHLDDKAANAGSNNFTKYGAWIGLNGQYWCASFICWCFDQAASKATKSTTKTSTKTTAASTKTTSTKKGYSGTFPMGVLKKGSKGTQVEYLQKFLNWYGPDVKVDGIVGDKTIAAIKSFEKAEGLKVDGEWGEECLKKAKTIKK